jgi:hypothetical protein
VKVLIAYDGSDSAKTAIDGLIGTGQSAVRVIVTFLAVRQRSACDSSGGSARH